jgi:peptide/nickel transport system substrate-binding protein
MHKKTVQRTSYMAILLVLLGMLAACAPAPTAAPSAAEPAAEATQPAEEAVAPAVEAGEVSRADTLIFASDTTDLISLDPAVAYEFSGIQAEGSIYETLVSFTPGQPGVKPLLAESWEIAEDGEMWKITFKLNPNAKFASGNPVTADDFVYSWSRVIDLNKSPAFLLIDTSGVTKENLKAVDAQTFEVKIPKSKSPQVFLAVIAFTVAAPVEKAIVEANAGEDMGSTWLNDHSAGSGPYVLTSWDREVAITLDANPNYWGEAPQLKRVIMQNIAEATNRQSAIETGDADIVQDLSPEQKQALAGNPDVVLNVSSNTQIIYIGMNAKAKPFDNPDVRQAVRYAINYDEIIALTNGEAELVQEIIPVGFLGHTGKDPFKQDIAKAKELLAKAGYPDGIEFDALVPANFPAGPIDFPTLAAKVQADLEMAGMKMNINQLQISELLNIYRSEESDKKQMVFILWGPDYSDPDTNAMPFSNYAARSIAWRNGWENAEAADLAAKAAVGATDEERVKLYAELTELLQNQGPYAVLYQPTRTYALRSNIEGFLFDPADTPNITFANISKK